MLKLYDKDGQDITDQPTNCFCDNLACLGEPWCSAWGICSVLDVEPEMHIIVFFMN